MPLDKDLKAIAAARAKAAATARYTGQATRGTPTSVTRKPTPTRKTVTHGRPGRTAAAPKKPTYDSGTAAVKPKKSKNKHQVKEGQNIETLALDFGVPSAEILRANPGVQRLRPGQVLNIPEPIVTAAQNTQRRQWVEDQARLVEQQKPGQRPSGRIHETIDLTQAENQVKPFWQQTPWETFQQITNAIFQPKNKLQSRVHEEAQGSRIQGRFVGPSPDVMQMQQERAQGYTVPASGPGLTGYTPQPWTQEDYDRQIRVQGWRWTGNALTAWARGEGDIDARPDYLDPEFVAQVPGLAEKLLNGQFGYILGPDGIWRKKSLAPLPGGGYYGNYQSTPYYGGGGSARRRSGGRGRGGGGGGGGKSNDGVVYGVGSRLSDEGGMFARPDSGRAPFEVQAAAHWRI